MKAKSMKAEIVKVIRTETVEGKGTEESPVQREKILDFRRRTDFRANIDGRKRS